MKGPLFNAMLSARLTLRPERRLPAPSLGVPLLVTALLCIGYLIWAPTAPDLLAQVARAGVAARAGSVGWWTGWFGGLSLPSYSVLVPSWMATVGIQVTGVAAVAASAAGGALLMRDAPRAAVEAALATACAGRCHQSFPLVVPQCGGGHPGALRALADREPFVDHDGHRTEIP